MRVTLAGCNRELTPTADPTPEIIAAAYARISRSEKSIEELRATAAADVPKARSSNRRIVFSMGHASIAEHAVFNFDIVGVSRLLAETIQRSRLASFTEKSQRYVTFTADYYRPEELDATSYDEVMNRLFARYHQLSDRLTAFLQSQDPEADRHQHELRAREEARYVLPLCTFTQMGMTINARSLERLLARLNASPLSEANVLAGQLYNLVQPVAPSLVRYVTNTYQPRTFAPEAVAPRKFGVKLLEAPREPEARVAAAWVTAQTGYDHKQALVWYRGLTATQKDDFYRELLTGLTPHSSLPRCFEAVDFVWQADISASCYAQLKRHRLATIDKAPYHSLTGQYTPQLLRQAGLNLFTPGLKKQLMALRTTLPAELRGYSHVNADLTRCFIKMNLRELCHFTRLRQDAHAQEEIRLLAGHMVAALPDTAPRLTAVLGGKDEFAGRA